jgi:hypothetical protein
VSDDLGPLSQTSEAFQEKLENIKSVGFLEVIILHPKLRSHILPLFKDIFRESRRTNPHLSI